jgi:hypothetical protein
VSQHERVVSTWLEDVDATAALDYARHFSQRSPRLFDVVEHISDDDVIEAPILERERVRRCFYERAPRHVRPRERELVFEQVDTHCTLGPEVTQRRALGAPKIEHTRAQWCERATDELRFLSAYDGVARLPLEMAFVRLAELGLEVVFDPPQTLIFCH